MDYSQWFQQQLQTTLDGFIWALQQVPASNRYRHPPQGLGDWCAARQLFHITIYERDIALPSMEQWLDKPIPPAFADDEWDEDAEWLKVENTPLDQMIEDFRAVRAGQLALIPQISDSAWLKTLETGWGNVNLLWVVSKTWQHTAEHTSTLMRIALFWDMFADDSASA